MYKLAVKNAIVDGGSVCVDTHGVSQFNQPLRLGADPIFYDLLRLTTRTCEGCRCWFGAETPRIDQKPLAK